jgi:hypothetical protein
MVSGDSGVEPAEPWVSTWRATPAFSAAASSDVVQDVLMQCFERRCLTYTPANPLAWRVEMGNVGLHYYSWRYDAEMEPPDTGEPPVEHEPPIAAEAFFTAGFEEFGSAEIDEGSRTVVEEGYLIDVNTEGYEIGALVPQLTVEDVIVRATVRVLSEEATGAFCVVARRNLSTGDRYQACVWANGDVSLGYSTANGAEALFLEEGYVQPPEFSPGVQVGLLVSGANLWLEINGGIVGHVTHEGSGFGGVGLMAVGTGIFLVINYAVYDVATVE